MRSAPPPTVRILTDAHGVRDHCRSLTVGQSGVISMLWRTTTATILVALVHPAPAAAQQDTVSFRVAGWNLESGESTDALLRSQFADKQGVHLWGLSEVRGATALAAFEQGAEDGEGADFTAVLGTTGGGDRLAIIFSTGRFELLGTEELFDIQPTRGSAHRWSRICAAA